MKRGGDVETRFAQRWQQRLRHQIGDIALRRADGAQIC